MFSGFQSAPGLEAGRSKLKRTLKKKTPNKFQSAPGLEAGRSTSVTNIDISITGFQSAPGLEAGRSENKLSGALMIS